MDAMTNEEGAGVRWKLMLHVSIDEGHGENWREEPWHPLHDFVTVDYLNALEAEVKALRERAEAAERERDEARHDRDADYANWQRAERERNEHQWERQRLAIQALQDLDELEALRLYKALADEVSAAWRDAAESLADVKGLAEWPMDWLARYDALAATAAEPAVVRTKPCPFCWEPYNATPVTGDTQCPSCMAYVYDYIVDEAAEPAEVKDEAH